LLDLECVQFLENAFHPVFILLLGLAEAAVDGIANLLERIAVACQKVQDFVLPMFQLGKAVTQHLLQVGIIVQRALSLRGGGFGFVASHQEQLGESTLQFVYNRAQHSLDVGPAGTADARACLIQTDLRSFADNGLGY
jgi:hypothetical protein